jgi:hypothetical protein
MIYCHEFIQIIMNYKRFAILFADGLLYIEYDSIPDSK